MFFSKRPYIEFGDEKQRRVILARSPFTIGSAEDCNITIQSDQVAPLHIRLVETAEGWNLKLDGRNPVLINGTLLLDADRNLTSGDVFEIRNVVAMTFRDPAWELERQKAAGEQGQTAAEADLKRRLRLFVPLVAVCLAVSAGAIFLAPGKQDATGGEEAAGVGDRTVQQAVDDLRVCIGKAADRIKQGKIVSEVDPKGDYWRLAGMIAAGSSTDAETEKLQTRVRGLFGEALLLETRKDKRRALQVYEDLRRMVPDINCQANRLAAVQAAALK